MANEKQLIHLGKRLKLWNALLKAYFPNMPCQTFEQFILNSPTVDAIPIAVMKRAIKGIDAADQCDQAGRYDYELRAALKTVLKWYESPLYKEYEANTNLEG